MIALEKVKYMEPKLSYSLRPLILHFQINDEPKRDSEKSHKNYESLNVNKTIISNEGNETRQASQSLWLDTHQYLIKPSTASQATRMQYNELISNPKKFVPLSIKYSMMVPFSDNNSVKHSRGCSIENVPHRRGKQISSILRYQQY